jgi:hypothetical protein
MGMFDYIQLPDGSVDQVKIFHCTLEAFPIGERVPTSGKRGELPPTFSVVLPSGGAMNVEGYVYKSFTPAPLFSPVFDKWGNAFQQGD